MAGGSTVFEWACNQLELLTTMSRLQARGTLRLALGNAGLDIETLTGRQFRVVAMKLLAKELRARAIVDADQICAELVKIPSEVEAGAGLLHQSAADIFKRLGRKE